MTTPNPRAESVLGRSTIERAAQPPEQHVLRRLAVGVVLEACALGRLGQRRAGLRCDRVAEHRQPAVAAPVIQGAALERLPSRRESDRRPLRAGGALATSRTWLRWR